MSNLRGAEVVWDIEADSLTPTKIHFAVACPANSDSLTCFAGPEAMAIIEADPAAFKSVFTTVEPLSNLPDVLVSAKRLIGHSIMGYDIPVAKRLLGAQIRPCFDSLDSLNVWDTQLVAKIQYADTNNLDFAMLKSGVLCGKDLLKPHSLHTWGKRIGVLKQAFEAGKDGENFSVVTKEMLLYGAQDVVVTRALYCRQTAWDCTKTEAMLVEHEFRQNMRDLEDRGFCFDTNTAERLLAEITSEHSAIAAKLANEVPPKIIQLKTKTKSVPFNPGSRPQVAAFLQTQGWVPEEFTPSGQPKVDETVLDSLTFPTAPLFRRYFQLTKCLGQLSDGTNGWLKLVGSDGRIHGSVNTIGAITRRCTHSRPNMAQVPSSALNKDGSPKTPYGPQFRGLFRAAPGFKLVGTDAKGLQLRCLGHYMARYDGGAYAKVVLEGDPHATNQQIAGLPTRDLAKTFIYALLFGAGDEKIGNIVGGDAAAGRALKMRFLSGLPALKALQSDLLCLAKSRGWLKGLDGGPVIVRSQHAVLNTLLMSAEAVVMKTATNLFKRSMETSGLMVGADWGFVAHVHDEWQSEVRADAAQQAADLGCAAITAAGEHFGFRCRLDGDSKVGDSWADTH